MPFYKKKLATNGYGGKPPGVGEILLYRVDYTGWHETVLTRFENITKILE